MKTENLIKEMSVAELNGVNGGWSLENAAIAGATASICTPYCPAFVAIAFVVGGFCDF